MVVDIVFLLYLFSFLFSMNFDQHRHFELGHNPTFGAAAPRAPELAEKKGLITGVQVGLSLAWRMHS
jgi:hypothetical protein